MRRDTSREVSLLLFAGCGYGVSLNRGLCYIVAKKYELGGILSFFFCVLK